MGTNVTNEGGISRRSFLGGVAGVGALAAMGLAGCSPKAAGTTGAESASSSASAATGVADNNAVAVDDGSAAITVDWLGARRRSATSPRRRTPTCSSWAQATAA